MAGEVSNGIRIHSINQEKLCYSVYNLFTVVGFLDDGLQFITMFSSNSYDTDVAE